MKKLILLLFVSLATVSTFAQSRIVSMETELMRLLNTHELARYNPGSAVRQVSSYDRQGGNNDGFEGTYSFLRKNEDGSLVIFEAKGKGVIERIWTPTPTDDTLDFYFDGEQVPSYSIKFRDLFSGKVSPFLNPVTGQKVGGWYSYLPIPFSDGCKIVFRGNKILFHQIQYRQYEDSITVTTFNSSLSPKAKATLDKVITQWSNENPLPGDHYSGKLETIVKDEHIQPGKSITLANIRKGGRIVGIQLSPANLFEGLENSFDIKITWDDEKAPAVYAPVADFFGYAFGAKSMKGLLMGVKGNEAYSFINMPFDKSARIELIYRQNAKGQKAVRINSKVNFSPVLRTPATEGKFYAFWKRERPAIGQPYVLIEGSGKGHYVGTLLLSQATNYDHFTEFFEGDDSTVLDGKYLLHGTGSEDYFNGGWYAQPGGWVERKGAPLHGCLDYSLPFSRTGGYRFYVLDKLPFDQHIYHSMEHGPEGNNRPVEYTSVAMYYAEKPIAIGKVPTNLTTRIFVPDTLSFYSRLMDHLTYEGDAKLVHGNAELESGKQGTILINTNELSAGKYQVFLHGRGVHELKAGVNSATNRTTLKTSGSGSAAMQDYQVGMVQITDPTKPVKLHLESGNNKLQLNRIYFVKQR